MCRLALQDGASALVASPHMFDGVYHVTRQDVLDGVARLRRRLEEESVPLTVEPGADVHIDRDLLRLLHDGQVVTIADGGRYIMLELPGDVWPQGLPEFLYSLQLEGLTPIISHPERNLAVQDDPLLLTPLVQAGNLVQITAASLTGDFGKRPHKCALRLLRDRLAHVVASDAHSAQNRPPGLSDARSVVQETLSPDEASMMFEERPRRILAGDYVDLPDVEATPPRARKGWFPWRK